MKKLLTAVSMLLVSGVMFASAQTSSSTCIVLSQDLTIGVTDATSDGQVSILQNFLNDKGFFRFKTDNKTGTIIGLGNFGPQTAQGVMQFQKNFGITPTGYVGPLTRANIQTLTCAVGVSRDIVNQVVDTASTTNTATNSLLTFSSPAKGDLIIKGEKDLSVDWTIAPGATTTFPLTYTRLKMSVINTNGEVLGFVGNGVPLSNRHGSNRISGEFQRTLTSQGRRNDDNTIPTGVYKIRASLEYTPAAVLCSATVTTHCVTAYSAADQALMASAATYGADSNWFYVVNPAPKPEIRVSTPITELTTSSPITITWTATASSTNCTFTDVIASTTINVSPSGSQVVTPVASSSPYRVACDLTSEWPVPGMTYTTNAQKTIKISVGALPAPTPTATISTAERTVDGLTVTGTAANTSMVKIKISNSVGRMVYESSYALISRSGTYSKLITTSEHTFADGTYKVEVFPLLATTAAATKTITIGTTNTNTNTSTNTSSYRNFVAGSQSSCNSSIVSVFGSQVATCTIGGGCSIAGTPALSADSSANPTSWGACVPSVATSIATLTATPSSGNLTSVSGGTPTLWVTVTVNNYTPQGNELVNFGDGATSALGYTTSLNSRHDYHTAGTYEIKLTRADSVVATTNVTVSPMVNNTTDTATFRNFVAGSQATCNSSIVSVFGSQVATCTQGGGCTITGTVPDTTHPSANPTSWGACVPSSANGTSVPSSTAPAVTLSPSVTTTYGGTATITWSVSPTTGVTCVSAGGNLAAGTAIGTTGSWVTPALYTTTQYGIKCTNAAGQSTTKYTTVTVPTQTSTANTIKINLSGNTTIDYGKTTTIKWSVSPTTGVTCVAAGGNLAAGTAIGTTGSWVTPALYTTTQYGIKCTNSAGEEAYKYTTVTVRAARTSMTSSPTVLGANVSCVDLPYNFHRGNESQSVTNLQNFLISNGYLNDNATGFFGDKTVSAVKAYQESRGLPMTGMVYGLTRDAIRSDSCN